MLCQKNFLVIILILNMKTTRESFETWWIMWIKKESLSRHDESHESKKRVFRVIMNRMNRKRESCESSWIVWIENKSLTSHHVLHDSTNESWQVMMTRLDSSFSETNWGRRIPHIIWKCWERPDNGYFVEWCAGSHEFAQLSENG